MLELPEAKVISDQIKQKLVGQKVVNVVVAQSPHKFTWYKGNPQAYIPMLMNKKLTDVRPVAGTVEIEFENVKLVLSDGTNIRYIDNEKDLPKKHQLLLTFNDDNFLAVSVQMYGGIVCFENNDYDNKYYQGAKAKPSPLTSDFNKEYWTSLFANGTEKMSVKAFLATEQRIPGLGNGVLQDILFNAGLHPKRKIATLSQNDKDNLYNCIIKTLNEMTEKDGRNTEKDLYGNEGSYVTKMSSKTVGQKCPNCGQIIQKMAYMGGSVYFCPECQK